MKVARIETELTIDHYISREIVLQNNAINGLNFSQFLFVQISQHPRRDLKQKNKNRMLECYFGFSEYNIIVHQFE